MKISILIRTSFFAYHRWKDAPEEVAFLRVFHPHQFNVEAEIEVHGDNRDEEFYIVRKYIDEYINKELKDKKFEFSCEQICQQIIEHLIKKYGKRDYIITIREDDQNAGRVYKYE